jgi:RNA polymerase sigma-70 factor (ECF subfamily)
LQQLDDNQLMQEVKAGRLDRLGELFARYSRKLYVFFYRMTGEREVSQDLVQNVFERILKYRHTFTGEGFITWMYHLARNVSADHFRKAGKFRFSKNLDAWSDKVTDGVQADAEVQKEQELQLLHAALQKLSVEKREVLTLSRYQELKYEEIARILDCTEGAVKVRVHRAMQDLKTIYHELLRERSYQL